MQIVRALAILQYLTNRFYTLADIGKAVGMTRGAISNKVSRGSELKDDDIKKIEDYFNISFTDFPQGQTTIEKMLRKKKTFGQRLNYLMTENDLIPEYLEKDTKISAKRITKMIMDEEKPTLDELRALKKYFNVSLDLLLDGDGDIKPVLSDEERKILEVFKKAKDNNLF